MRASPSPRQPGDPLPGPPDLLFGATSAPTVISGGLWTLLNRALPQVQLLALSVITARYLGPSDMGRQSYIAFVALALVQAGTAGVPTSLARFVGELLGARAGGQAMSLYRLTYRVELVAAMLVLVSLLTVAALGGDPAGAWVVAGLSGALAVLQSVPNAMLIGAQLWRQSSTPGLVTGVATVPLSFIALEAGGGITGLFVVEAAAVLGNLVWTSALARRAAERFPPPEPAPPELRRRFWSFAGSTTIITVINLVVWRRSELFVLQQVSTDAQIAFYSIAFATISGLAKLPETVEAVAMPAVANLLGTGERDRIRRGFWRAIRLLGLTIPALVAGVAVTGPPGIELIYGGEYAGAGDVMLVMLAPLLVQPMLTMSQAILYGLGRPLFIVYAGLTATVVDIGLALLLIPSLDAVGAAIANGVAQLVAGVPCLILASRLHLPVDRVTGPVLRGLGLGLVVAATAGAVLLGLGTGVAGTLAAVAGGTGGFLAVAMAVRPFPQDDARWLADALGSRGARGATGRLVRRLAPREAA